jgi:hypothetical protein
MVRKEQNEQTEADDEYKGPFPLKKIFRGKKNL